jgi:hypothetical protein
MIVNILDPVEPDETLVATIPSDIIFKCEKCYFETATKLIFSKHQQLKHSWCYFC